MSLSSDFWSQQRVLLTGHTGFKGAWACCVLERLGACVAGFALPSVSNPSLFALLRPFDNISTVYADIADAVALEAIVTDFRPTLLLHMAAQPLVRRSYRKPIQTFQDNIMGTANVLQAARLADDLKAALIVTTDKVYHNLEEGRSFVESDQLGGKDPYSASKAAAEIVTRSFAESFFDPRGKPVATARAGNVIGGGDWSEDRLIPDIWRSVQSGTPLELRYPKATRPWQHVLEPITGYLLYLERLASNPSGVPRALNFGPKSSDRSVTVGEVATLISAGLDRPSTWVEPDGEEQPSEMLALALDSSLAASALNWTAKLTGSEALQWTIDWYRSFDAGLDPRVITFAQIDKFLEYRA